MYCFMDNKLTKLKSFEKKELLKQLKVTWTYNSNAIEGNTLSEGDTSFIIESGLTVQGKSLSEHNQVVGHIKAIDLIYGLLDKDHIDEKDLFTLHKAIQTEFVLDYEKPNGAYKVVPNGRWKKIEKRDKLFYYPHPDYTQHLMDLWFTEYGHINIEIKNKEEAVKIYTDAHIAFTSIHPFWDGNGRLARLVANLPLLKNEYLPIIINNEHRQEYQDIQFEYQMNSKPLDIETAQLIDENSDYSNLLNFFSKEYKNSEKLLKEIKNSRKQLKTKTRRP